MPKIRSARALAAAALLVASTAPALAHPGHGSFAFSDGLLHPLFGVDHLLAGFAVGLLAWRLGGRALLGLPAAFLALMLIGAATGASGLAMSGREFIIALSVIALGAALALDVRAPMVISAAVVGIFAFAHGQAHAAEIPATAGFAGYAGGLMIATALLHAAGIGLGINLSRSAIVMRALGALIALAGVVIATA